jgi:hypothetical protein
MPMAILPLLASSALLLPGTSRMPEAAQRIAASCLVPACLSLCLLASSPDAALAVSGGGKDFSGQELEGRVSHLQLRASFS